MDDRFDARSCDVGVLFERRGRPNPSRGCGRCGKAHNVPSWTRSCMWSRMWRTRRCLWTTTGGSPQPFTCCRPGRLSTPPCTPCPHLVHRLVHSGRSECSETPSRTGFPADSAGRGRTRVSAGGGGIRLGPAEAGWSDSGARGARCPLWRREVPLWTTLWASFGERRAAAGRDAGPVALRSGSYGRPKPPWRDRRRRRADPGSS